MSLLRVAFESDDDDLILMTVLCAGCYAELSVKLDDTRRWARPMSGGSCDFCQAEVRASAVE